MTDAPKWLEKLRTLVQRHEELGRLLSQPDVINDQTKFRSLSKEYAQLESISTTYQDYERTLLAKNAAEEIFRDADPEMRELAQEESLALEQKLQQLETQLQLLLLPKDPNDTHNVFLEIRAGTGGDEAAIFAGDLLRMYSRFAETQGWSVEIISESHGEHGGYKEVITRVHGNNVYSKLKFESGAHRVQRVPVTESQGRIHTSACTVAVLPEVDEIDAIEINPADLKVDTFRASGAGGQHVNKTESAIRITHLPSGVVVECQDERSQHKNRAKAMSLLQSRLLASEQEKQSKERSEARRLLVGSGDRSERIRTYNFPQGRVTDHRINLTLYKLDEVLEGGALSEILQPLIREHQAKLLAETAEA